jgi:adenylate cyclase
MPFLILIEDDQHIQRIFRERLIREGFQVATADDGEQGFQCVRDLRPDIILLDIMLPKMDGLQVLKHIREDATLANIPVFILSNRTTSNDIQRARALGARRFFAKGTSALHDILWHIRNECDYRKVLVCAPNAETAAPIISTLDHPQVLCSVVTALSDAIGTASHDAPDVIVLDARPPALNAGTALQQLKSSPATKLLPVIAIHDDGQAVHRADVVVVGANVANDLRAAVMKLLKLEQLETAALATASD